MKRRLAGFTAVCLLLASCAKREKEVEAEPVVPVQVADAGRDSIQRIVSADAILYPVNQASLMPKISAPVRSFTVNRGDHVRQGEVVAVLENRDLAASVAENKGNYESAEAAYRTTTAATLPEDINKAHQDVDAAKQALEASQKLYESRKQLFEQGALARRLVDEANVSYAQAKSQYQIAQTHLQALESVSRHEQLKSAAAQVESARARYEAAQAQLSYSEIRSPISGVVTDRPLYAGEMASSGTALMTVMDTSRVIARANVPVAQAAYLKVGNPATITQADTSIQAQGNITVVSAAVDPNSTTVEVWVRAENPGEKLKPGSTVRVSAVPETIPDTIVIPAAALLPSQEGGTSVLVIGSDSVAHERKVEVGVREPEKIQVLKGLKAGEKVVVAGGVGVQDGARVRIRKPGENDQEEKPGASAADKE